MKKIQYRFAFVEALRQAIAGGETFPEDIIDMVENSDCQGSLSREDVCSVCRGSEMSGDALLCDSCNVAETHLHCLTPQLAGAPVGDWFCEACLVLKGLPQGYMPSDQEPAMESIEEFPAEPIRVQETLSPSLSLPRGRGRPPGKRKRNSITPSTTDSGSYTQQRTVSDNLQKLISIETDSGFVTPAISSSGVDGRNRSEGCVHGANSVFGKSNGCLNGTVRPCSGHPFKNTCMVCDLDGVLQLCDYPGCQRGYHRVNFCCNMIFVVLNLMKSFTILPDLHSEEISFICISSIHD